VDNDVSQHFPVPIRERKPRSHVDAESEGKLSENVE
jgi:hypothetical protein